MRRVIWLWLLAAMLTAPAWAQDDEPAAAPPGAAGVEAIYVPFKPPFVVNYGGPGRLKFIKAELVARAANPSAADAVRYHTPLIRNNLIMLFAAQTEADLASQEGREALRQAALEEVRVVVETEGGVPREAVVDVYFNSLVVQN